MTGLDQVLVKKKSKLELEKEAAAAAPREATVKKQAPRVRANADRRSSAVSRHSHRRSHSRASAQISSACRMCAPAPLADLAIAHTEGQQVLVLPACMGCLTCPAQSMIDHLHLRRWSPSRTC